MRPDCQCGAGSVGGLRLLTEWAGRRFAEVLCGAFSTRKTGRGKPRSVPGPQVGCSPDYAPPPPCRRLHRILTLDAAESLPAIDRPRLPGHASTQTRRSVHYVTYLACSLARGPPSARGRPVSRREGDDRNPCRSKAYDRRNRVPLNILYSGVQTFDKQPAARPRNPHHRWT